VVELCKVSHSHQEQAFPNPHFLFERTNILIGAKGWRRIATDENCEEILSHMKVTVSAGHGRASMNVASLFDIT
jgi:hypothetical protein